MKFNGRGGKVAEKQKKWGDLKPVSGIAGGLSGFHVLNNWSLTESDLFLRGREPPGE